MMFRFSGDQLLLNSRTQRCAQSDDAPQLVGEAGRPRLNQVNLQIISTSTEEPSGNCAIPKAVQACRPASRIRRAPVAKPL